jgi:hypothetical protein
MEIERDIPITDMRGMGRTPLRPCKYPWPDMEIGDSFQADVPPDTLRASASKWGRAHGRKFTVRKYGDGSRAWRIA